MRIGENIVRATAIRAAIDLQNKIDKDNLYSLKFATYWGSEEKILVYCKKCKSKGLNPFFRITPHSLKKGHGCRVCAGNHNYSTEEWVSMVKKSNPKTRDLLFDRTEYINSETAVEIGCKKHGYFYKYPTEISRSDSYSGCPKCSQTASLGFYNIIKRLRKLYNKDYTLLHLLRKNYTDNRNKITLKCRKHNKLFTKSISTLLAGQGCPICAEENKQYKEFSKYGVLHHTHRGLENYADWINEDFFYSNSKNNIFYRTINEASKYFNCHPTTVSEKLKKLGIRFKTPKKSSLEKSILRYIKLIYKKEIIQSDREIIQPFELDIVLPDIKLAIEVNGLYWHSDRQKPKDYHFNKQMKSRDKNYNIFYIWEDQWNNKTKRMIIKSMLKSKLGKIKNKIYARKTTVKKLDKTPMQFYNYNHLQGAVGATYNYGLFLEDELVSAMSFKKDGELIRFATKINMQVIGGFSKLLKAFERDNPQIKEIVSFSDNDYSDGKVYKENGFKIIKELKQDYFISDRSDIRLHKFSVRKNRLRTKYKIDIQNKTERQLLDELDLLRCYNSGKTKFYKGYK